MKKKNETLLDQIIETKAQSPGYKQTQANSSQRIGVLLANVKCLSFICNRAQLSKLFAGPSKSFAVSCELLAPKSCF